MANARHLMVFKQGVMAWNAWRRQHPDVKPDLSDTVISNADFSEIDLSEANLSRTRLSALYLTDANFFGANLTDAKLDNLAFENGNLSQASLRNAYLSGVSFIWTKLKEADFTSTSIGWSSFSNTDLSNVIGLQSVGHFAPSTVGVDSIYKSGGKIPESFLLGCGVPQSFIDMIPSLVGAIEPFQYRSCFISYSTKDEEFARRLHSRLRDANVRVWYSPEDAKGGVKMRDQIERAIQVHDRLLLVLSEHSIQSAWVESEIRKALEVERREKRRKLFPIRLTSFDALRQWQCFDADVGRDLAVEVREYFIPDFANWQDHNSFERGFERLLKDLREAEEQPTSGSN